MEARLILHWWKAVLHKSISSRSLHKEQVDHRYLKRVMDKKQINPFENKYLNQESAIEK